MTQTHLPPQRIRPRKPCVLCGGAKEPGERRRLCEECRATRATRSRVYKDQWGAANPNYMADRHRQRRYGISPEAFSEMVKAQGGRCKICRRIPEDRLQVDHCHATGKIRSLLCRKCNSGMGNLLDDPRLLREAAAYLERTL